MSCPTCGGTGCIEHNLPSGSTYCEPCYTCGGDGEPFVIPAQDEDFDDGDYGRYDDDANYDSEAFTFHDFD